MAEIDLIKNLEHISFKITNRLLNNKVTYSMEDSKEFLEIIIYRGFSRSKTRHT